MITTYQLKDKSKTVHVHFTESVFKDVVHLQHFPQLHQRDLQKHDSRFYKQKHLFISLKLTLGLC